VWLRLLWEQCLASWNTPKWLGPAEPLRGQSTPDRFPGVAQRRRRHSCEAADHIPRHGQVITLNTDRPVLNTIITADGEPPGDSVAELCRRARYAAVAVRAAFLRPSNGGVRRDAATSRGRTSLGSMSATTPLAWNRYPGSRRGLLILPDRQPTTPTSLWSAVASNHDQRECQLPPQQSTFGA
jgi:hypothetical protein